MMNERTAEEDARDLFHSNSTAFVARAWGKLRKSLFHKPVCVLIFASKIIQILQTPNHRPAIVGIFNLFVGNINCLDPTINPEQ
jgi:hypothetical protein